MKNIIYLLLGAVIATSCSGVKVTADYDKTVNFTKYKTFEYYGWVEESDEILTRFDKERIEKAFAEEFKARGYELVEEGGDLIVALFVHTKQKTATTATTMGTGGYGYGGYYGYGPGYRWGGGYSTTTYNNYDYVEGTLVCDIYDKAEEVLIWEGIGTKTVDSNPQARDRSIPYAVKKIMAQYPIKPISGK